MGSFPLQMLIIFAASSTHSNYFVRKEHCKVSRMKLSPIYNKSQVTVTIMLSMIVTFLHLKSFILTLYTELISGKRGEIGHYNIESLLRS